MKIYAKTLKANLEASIRAKHQLLAEEARLESFGKAVSMIMGAYRNGGRLYIAGNGGSAADAQHLAAEFVCKLSRPRAGLPAEALTVDSSALTAIGNDFGFDEIFARQVEAKMTRRDVFLGITTSGDSPNIIRAVEKCRELGIMSIVFTGRGGGKAKSLADYCVVSPGEATSQIQEVHSVLCHTLCQCIEETMFPALVSREKAERIDRSVEVTPQLHS